MGAKFEKWKMREKIKNHFDSIPVGKLKKQSNVNAAILGSPISIRNQSERKRSVSSAPDGNTSGSQPAAPSRFYI